MPPVQPRAGSNSEGLRHLGTPSARLPGLLGQRLYTSTFHPQVLQKALKSADVLIGALSNDILMPWFYVTEEMVQGMKRGSVIVDLSVDTGGCVETAEPRAIKDPIYEKHGVIHYSAWNLPSRVPKTASIALSNVFRPLMQEIADAGGITPMLKFNNGLRDGVYVYNGILTNEMLGSEIRDPFKRYQPAACSLLTLLRTDNVHNAVIRPAD